MKYLDRLLAQNDLIEEKEDEVICISDSNTIKQDVYDVELEEEMLRRYECIDWLKCLSIDSLEDNKNVDYISAKDIGIELIVNIFCRKIFELEYFIDKMLLMNMRYMGAHKLYLHLKKTYNKIVADKKSTAVNYSMNFNDVEMTPK